MSDNPRLLQAMAAAAPATWDWEVGTNIFQVSPGLRALHGLTESQGVSLDELRGLTASSHREWIAWVERVVREHEPGNAETFLYPITIPLSGQKKWIEASLTVDRDLDEPLLVRGITGVLRDVTERIKVHNSLIESEERLRLAVEAGKMAIWEVDLQTGVVTNTRELNLLFGFPPDSKPTMAELRSRYAPGEVERLAKDGATWEVVRKRFEAGEFSPRDHQLKRMEGDRTQVQAEVTIILPTNVTKHLLYRAQYAYSLEGRPKITGFLVDITEQKLAEDRLSVVVRELHHRFKNTIAVVHAMAKQSFNKSTPNGAMETFLGRLTALSAATDMILQNEGANIDFGKIVTSITGPYRSAHSDPFVIEGPRLSVSTKTAEAISMILHELCINALKYGALSLPSGRVYLKWEIGEQDEISISWKEVSGPEPRQSRQRGYGTKLIEVLVTGELQGTATMNFERTGLICTIESGPFRANPAISTSS